MKLIVCVKQIVDIAANFSVNQGQVHWSDDAPQMINPWDEFAVEAALVQKENSGAEVIALSVGEDNAREALKHALAMGCDSAVHIRASANETQDSQSVASILAAAVQKVGDVDVVFFGKQSSDTEYGVLAVQTARKLKWPALTLVSSITQLDDSQRKITCERSMEEGKQVIESRLPLVVSVNKDIGEPRFPSFLGTRKAARANIPAWSLSEIGVSSSEPAVKNLGMEYTSQRKAELEWIEGDSPNEIARNLIDRLVNEKVI